MAEVIWGLATSHVPSIGAAMDRGKTQDAYWKPLFDGYQPARDWMARHAPDVALIIYNDHANAFDVDMVPTFAIGTADTYHVADEGFGPRPVPDVAGAPELSQHLVEKRDSRSSTTAADQPGRRHLTPQTFHATHTSRASPVLRRHGH
jgi:protocatechuate 4,5-dioxygenase, beta chain